MERLTLDMENGAFAYFDKLDAMGGMVKAIERGFPQKEIAEARWFGPGDEMPRIPHAVSIAASLIAAHRK